MQLYVKINRAFSDPIFHADSFWDLPSAFIVEVANELIEQEKSTANQNSITSAHIVETLRLIATSIGGGKNTEYDPSTFLPYPPTEEAEKVEEFNPTDETIDLFLNELGDGRVPAWVASNLAAQIQNWKKQRIEKK